MLPYLDDAHKFPTYGIMMILGIAVCFILLIFFDKNSKVGTEDKIYGGSFALLGGILGAKLLSVLTNISVIIENNISFIDVIKNGFVFYGGFIGGAAGIIIYCAAYKIKILDFFDSAALILPVGQAFGRVGCFLAGCCFGRHTDSFLGVTYHISADPGTPLGQSILPTQLFEAAYCLLIFVALIIIKKASNLPTRLLQSGNSNSLKKHGLRSGTIAALYMITYSICRFINEFFRFDAARGFVGAISTSQFISIFIFAAGCLIIFKNLRQSRIDFPDFKETDG